MANLCRHIIRFFTALTNNLTTLASTCFRVIRFTATQIIRLFISAAELRFFVEFSVTTFSPKHLILASLHFRVIGFGTAHRLVELGRLGVIAFAALQGNYAVNVTGNKAACSIRTFCSVRDSLGLSVASDLDTVRDFFDGAALARFTFQRSEPFIDILDCRVLLFRDIVGALALSAGFSVCNRDNFAVAIQVVAVLLLVLLHGATFAGGARRPVFQFANKLSATAYLDVTVIERFARAAFTLRARHGLAVLAVRNRNSFFAANQIVTVLFFVGFHGATLACSARRPVFQFANGFSAAAYLDVAVVECFARAAFALRARHGLAVLAVCHRDDTVSANKVVAVLLGIDLHGAVFAIITLVAFCTGRTFIAFVALCAVLAVRKVPDLLAAAKHVISRAIV